MPSSASDSDDLTCLQIPELLTKILNWLPIKDKLTSRLVCRQWRDILRDLNRLEDGRMFRFCPRISDKQIHDFLKSMEVFESVTFSNLDLSEALYINNKHQLPSIRQGIELGEWNSTDTVYIILTCCQRVDRFIFGKFSMGHLNNSFVPGILDNLTFPELSELSLKVPEESPGSIYNSKALGQHCSTLKLILKNGNFQKLKKFTMHLNMPEKWPENTDHWTYKRKICISVPLYFVLYEFIGRHVKTLKSLELRDEFNCREKERPWRGINAELSQFILENLKLESISINYGSFLILPCLMGTDKLSNFSCKRFRFSGDPKSMNLIKLTEMLKRNQQNLVELDMSTESEAISMLQSLTGLPSLKKLKLRALNKIPRLTFRIPSLTSLKIDFYRALPNWDAWIIESFENLEMIHVSDTLNADPEDHPGRPLIGTNELNNLLTLKKISQISYGTNHYSGQKLDVLENFLAKNPNIEQKAQGFDYQIMISINKKLDGVPEVVTTFFIPQEKRDK